MSREDARLRVQALSCAHTALADALEAVLNLVDDAEHYGAEIGGSDIRNSILHHIPEVPNV
jgi:hypothetical protein